MANRLRSGQQRITKLREQLAQARVRLDRRYVTAQFAGTVHDLRVASAGDVVTPGDTILQIIPEQDPRVVTARVAPRDIGQLADGQIAEVRLTALSQRDTPLLTGTVERLSVQRLQDRENNASYSTARISIPAENCVSWARPS